ncbi:ribosomal protein L17, partial [Gaertneriomyces semiglobifer]
MKHGRRFWQKQLNRTASHRRSLLRNLLTQLVYHERIETTLPKAKFMQRAADKLIESAKERTPTSIATARSKLFVPHITLPKLLGPLAVRYATRTGGYTRIHMNGYRRSGTDRAPKAIVELVDNPKDIVYALAKQRYHEVKERLSVVESRLYQKRVVQIVDPMTGEECHAIKLLDREDVRGLEKKKLVQQELGLVKLTRKFEKSLQSYPLARAAEAEHQRTVLQRFQEENAHAVEEMQKK